MTKAPKLLAKAIARNNNLRFAELAALAEAFGFELDRVSGSHHIYVHRGAGAVLHLQPIDGKAKPYQAVNPFGKYPLTAEAGSAIMGA
jgi:hypothetical protein